MLEYHIILITLKIQNFIVLVNFFLLVEWGGVVVKLVAAKIIRQHLFLYIILFLI